MSESEKKVSRLISYLVDTYKYKSVPITLELGDVREIYRRNLPEWCKIDGDVVLLRTKRGTPVMRGYDRIVIGDYGAFVETTTDKIFRKYIRVKSDQAFRMNDPQYTKCKYIWLTATDESNVKIYFQKRPVNYADYVPGKIYVNPYELIPTFFPNNTSLQ